MRRSALAVAKLAIVATLAAGSPAFAADGPVRVGVGKISVTPGSADLPYAPSEAVSLNTGPGELPFVGVHDEIFARAIVMDKDGRRIALVVLETAAVPSATDITKAVAQAIGARVSDVVIAATHTHNIPLFSYAGSNPSPREQREINRLKDGAVAAVKAAAASLQPAKVAFGRGQAFINVNNGEQAASRTGYDFQGPSDKSLDVIRFETTAGKPIALLVNYASHAEVMFRSVSGKGGYEISGDLPGAVSRLIETKSADAPVVLFTAAAEGDQITLFKSLQRGQYLGGADEGAAGWALLNVQARHVAESVMSVLAALPAATPLTTIDAAATSVTCPGQQIKIDAKTGQTSTEPKPPVSIPLSVIRLNDIVLGGVGGDAASQIGAHFKSASPAPKSTMVTMAGNSVGYILTDASYVHPGHALSKSLLAPGCAEPAIVNGLVGLINGKK